MKPPAFSTPTDLAHAINAWLRSRSGDLEIPQPALIMLCETLYSASIATDEGDLVRVELVYIDPNQASPTADASWQVFAFGERFLFTLPNLIKLAGASDPRNSAIAVFHDPDGTVFIWGMIDQRDPAYRVLRREVSSRTHEACGLFEASIEGPANIFVHSGHELIGELNVGSLRIGATYVDVFRSGPISQICEYGIDSIATRLSAQLKESRMDDILAFTRQSFVSALCTVLLRLQNFRHGGAIIIRRNQQDDLKIRYPIKYNRLIKTLEQSVVQRAQQLSHAYDPTSSSNAINTLACEEILDSAIWFAAVLSRVDGTVVMDHELGVEGFGAIIRCQAIPPKEALFRATHAGADETTLEPLEYDYLGTRHQSMMRYCFEHPGTAGFVVSEDGDARAMSCIDGRLIIWENIKLLNVC